MKTVKGLVVDPWQKYQLDSSAPHNTKEQRRVKLLLMNDEPKSAARSKLHNTISIPGIDEEGPRKTSVFKQRAIDILTKPKPKDVGPMSLFIEPKSRQQRERDPTPPLEDRVDKILLRQPSEKGKSKNGAVFFDQDLNERHTPKKKIRIVKKPK